MQVSVMVSHENVDGSQESTNLAIQGLSVYVEQAFPTPCTLALWEITCMDAGIVTEADRSEG
jgi:hypothetical protein